MALTMEPMKIDTNMQMPPALEAPPGLEIPIQQAKVAVVDGYRVGDEVFAMRSNGTWSPGKIADITDEKVSVILKEGVKSVRRDVMHRVLRRADQAPQVPSVPVPDTAVLVHETAMLAQQKAALEVENKRLVLENAKMRMQSQSMAPMYDPYSQAGCSVMGRSPMAYQMQDPHGYMCNPWGIPQAACPQVYEDEASKNWFAKIGAKISGKNKKKSTSSDMGSLGSVSTNSGSNSTWGQSSVGDEERAIINALDDTPLHERTTVMMRNIPNNTAREQLLALIDEQGFQGCYDLLYLPIDLKNKVGLGYAFINFVSNEDAAAFSKHFAGFKGWKMQSEKVCEVTWSDALQGLDEHVERYRDCPVMHESIPDEFKPVLYKDGVRISFPEPTKRIRAPRPWSRRN